MEMIMKRIELFNVPMDSATIDETAELIFDRIKMGEFTQHVVVNVAKLVGMQTDAVLRESVADCDLINIDGMGIVWAGRLLGYEIPERVAGIDLFHKLLERAARDCVSVFLLGARQEIIESTAAVVAARYPGIKIAGFHHGYFWNEEERIIEMIRRSKAQMLFVAISSPLKENFINRWREKLGVSFVMGVGGTFDVVAGRVKRAPKWVRSAGLEWAFRLLQEPQRMWRRYLITNSRFAWMLWGAWRRGFANTKD
jgi:N-acetylglucosaminyldiphosphoundecaprenol N-acetyl-beta-D-mannosaminyltransferase